MSAIATGRLHAALRRVVDVRADETAALLVSFAYFFCVLSGWFVLRPIREATAAASGVGTLPYLFTGTLTVMLLANPVFSSLVVRFPVRRFIAITYHFFVFNLLLFYALLHYVAPGEGSAADLWIGRAFFVWTSVFNLFVVSIFWAFMADAFRSEQATRLFGFIAVGGTLGSVVGSATTAALAARIGTPNLMLVSAVLIELAVLCVVRFPARLGIPAEGESAAAEMPIGEVPLRARGDGPPIGGSIWAGITHVMRSPYLLGISALFVLFTIGSTTLYFQQADIVGRTYADRATRTTMLARLELVVQSLTLLTQLFFTGRLIRWVGMAAALAFLPLVSLLGFAALGTWPVFAVVAVLVVVRRAGNFGINNPALEILFTVLPREDKYKAKSFIETFVYRAGDQIGAWGFAGLTALGLSLSGIAYASVPLAAVWLVLAVWLGRRHLALAAGR